MLGKFFKKRSEDVQGATLYTEILRASRRPEFFGDGKLSDSYDGRVELLALHNALMLWGLHDKGEQAELLSQAIYDVMVDDFDVALREEGLTDTGVKRRIKPMVSLVMTRLVEYTTALKEQGSVAIVFEKRLERFEPSPAFMERLTAFADSEAARLAQLSLGDYQRGEVRFSGFASSK